MLLIASRRAIFAGLKSGAAAAQSKIGIRSISTSIPLCGRRNFRKFPIPNKRGLFEHPKLPKDLLENEYADRVVPIDDLRIRYPGVWFGKSFVYVREMEPELVIPEDWRGCELKPYVSYRVEDITQSQFTAEQLFNATYGREIVRKHRNNELDRDDESKYVEVDPLAAIEAKNRALKIGADLFTHTSYFGTLGKSWRYGH